MNKYDPPEPIRGEGRLNNEKLNWLIDSHLWFAYDNYGKKKCEWCGKIILSGQAVNLLFPGLCPQNPYVRALINEVHDHR